MKRDLAQRARRGDPTALRVAKALAWIACALILTAWSLAVVEAPGTATPPGTRGSAVQFEATPRPPSMPATRIPTRTSQPGASPTPSRLGAGSSSGSLAGPRLRPSVLPACTYEDVQTVPGPEGDWSLAVVDTVLRLPSRYAPSDLVPASRAGVHGGGLVRRIAIADLRDLVRAAKAGVPLAIQSAYRSERRQASVFAGWVAQSGAASARRSSARAGHSEHQLGTALDLRAARGSAPWTTDFERTKAGRWLATHAAASGFVMSYPKDRADVTCYAFEPWHFRWVGREVAHRIEASGLTPREWLYRIRNESRASLRHTH